MRTSASNPHGSSTAKNSVTVNGSMPTISPSRAPILKGKSNCPTHFGRKPGIASDPATGFIFANRVPAGNPSDPSYVLPLLDKVQRAIERVQTPPRLRVHSVAGDLGLHDEAPRQALHTRGILTVGIPKTIEPLKANPSPEEILDLLNEAGLNRQRTPHQVQLACACGYSRPVVESHIASLLARGAGHVPYKGLEGAVLQQGMTVMVHKGAVMVRIRRQRLSKRAQKFRRLLGFKLPRVNEINHLKNQSRLTIEPAVGYVCDSPHGSPVMQLTIGKSEAVGGSKLP